MKTKNVLLGVVLALFYGRLRGRYKLRHFNGSTFTAGVMGGEKLNYQDLPIPKFIWERLR